MTDTVLLLQGFNRADLDTAALMQNYSGTKAVLLCAQLSCCMQSVTVLHVICHGELKARHQKLGFANLLQTRLQNCSGAFLSLA